MAKRGETNTPTMMVNKNRRRNLLEFSPVSVLLTPDLSVSTEKQNKTSEKNATTRRRVGENEEEDLISHVLLRQCPRYSKTPRRREASSLNWPSYAPTKFS